ncbi:hypothetical protein GOACH_16_00350 [Gordonia aichiensis NBRC 108223]|uniref:Uncharacterized protein n=1 Tax=Gordonia aichiensis NBRC 108223 TaxID=1220583 RepID=L7KM10_9ACTN|nr:hypothetical protein GOACH_16_00350 [Gordonia aichiensis NBRC 108223]
MICGGRERWHRAVEKGTRRPSDRLEEIGVECAEALRQLMEGLCAATSEVSLSCHRFTVASRWGRGVIVVQRHTAAVA